MKRTCNPSEAPHQALARLAAQRPNPPETSPAPAMVATHKPRRLKIAEVGDFYARKTIPVIRLGGQWLARAGFGPCQAVTVEIPEDGTLIIRLAK